MAMLDDLETLLTDAGIGPVHKGGGLLTDPDTAVALLESPSLPPVVGMGVGQAGVIMEQAGVQVIVRAPEYEPGRALAVLALNALDNAGPTTINGVRYDDIRAQQRPPMSIGLDQNRRALFSFNLIVSREVTV